MKGIEKNGARGKPSTELSRDFFEGEGPLPLLTVGNIALLCRGKESPPLLIVAEYGIHLRREGVPPHSFF